MLCDYFGLQGVNAHIRVCDGVRVTGILFTVHMHGTALSPDADLLLLYGACPLHSYCNEDHSAPWWLQYN